MKKQRFEIYINGHHNETFKTLEEAQTWVRVEQRQDRYERDVEGYTNPLPIYEIKAV